MVLTCWSIFGPVDTLGQWQLDVQSINWTENRPAGQRSLRAEITIVGIPGTIFLAILLYVLGRGHCPLSRSGILVPRTRNAPVPISEHGMEGCRQSARRLHEMHAAATELVSVLPSPPSRVDSKVGANLPGRLLRSTGERTRPRKGCGLVRIQSVNLHRYRCTFHRARRSQKLIACGRCAGDTESKVRCCVL
jgi:hypothetical protein